MNEKPKNEEEGEVLYISQDSLFTICGDTTPVIKYMDIVKFFNILFTNSLWFARLDQFSDSYEGFATVNIEDSAKEVADRFRKRSIVSCWNHFRVESFPLWKIYLGGNKNGVAIISNVGLLKKSLINPENLGRLYAYGIDYVSPDYTWHGLNSSIVASRKKQFYSYEEEVRFAFEADNQPIGKAIKINPSILISEIILSPYMETWVKDLIVNILYEKNLSVIPLRDSIIRDRMLE